MSSIFHKTIKQWTDNPLAGWFNKILIHDGYWQQKWTFERYFKAKTLIIEKIFAIYPQFVSFRYE